MLPYNTDYSKLVKGRYYAVTLITEPRLQSIFSDDGTEIRYKGKVSKITYAVARFGIRYANLKQVKLAHGADYIPKPPTWGKFDDEEHPILIHHKGERYVRCYLNRGQRTVKYFDSDTNEEIPFETLKPFLNESDGAKDYDTCLVRSPKERHIIIFQ